MTPAVRRTTHPGAARAFRERAGEPQSSSLGSAAIFALILIVAAGLRLWHIDHGLPDFTEEAIVFRRALEMWGRGGAGWSLDPHWFVYPSLAIYTQFLVQHVYRIATGIPTSADFLMQMVTDPSGAVVLGRSVGVLADLVTLCLVRGITRPWGRLPSFAAMGLLALSPAMIRTSRQLYTDSMMTTFAIAAMHRLLAYTQRGGWTRLLAAGILIGLATGTKYPAALLLLPLGLAVWWREAPPERPRAWALGGASAILAFSCTTPYLLVNGSEFLRDAITIGDFTFEGSLGRITGSGLAYYAREMGRNVGWVGLGLLLTSLRSAHRLVSPGGTGLLWLCWLVLALPVLAVPVEAERYLAALVAAGAPLVAAGTGLLLAHVAPGRRIRAGSGLVALVLVQPAWSGLSAASLGRSTTQAEARLWCETHLGEHDLVLCESGGPQLLTYGRRAQVMADPIYRAASPGARSAFRSRRPFHLVWMPLIVSGYASVPLPGAPRRELDVYPHAVDWNGAAYDLRLLDGVDLVVTAASVRGRFELDPERFGEQARFYAFLDSMAERVVEFASGSGVDGPRIIVYRLGPRARHALNRLGPIDSLWWARTVPPGYLRAVDSLFAAEAPWSESVPNLPAWAQPLRASYASRYGEFANDLAENLASLGRLPAAERLCTASLTVLPEDLWAIRVYTYVAGQLGRWADLQATLERSVSARSRQGPVPADLLLAWANALANLDRHEEARDLLVQVANSGDPAAREEATRRLAGLQTATR